MGCVGDVLIRVLHATLGKPWTQAIQKVLKIQSYCLACKRVIISGHHVT
jgi:hypothetical protein